MPVDLQSEVTAALLACRVLDAYEDLVERPSASGAVLAAVAFLNGVSDEPPRHRLRSPFATAKPSTWRWPSASMTSERFLSRSVSKVSNGSARCWPTSVA
jgi:hypothetical protein